MTQTLTDFRTLDFDISSMPRFDHPPYSKLVPPVNAVGRSPYVMIDRSWARVLGVSRTSGVYRINRRDLVARLAAMELSVTRLSA